MPDDTQQATAQTSNAQDLGQQTAQTQVTQTTQDPGFPDTQSQDPVVPAINTQDLGTQATQSQDPGIQDTKIQNPVAQATKPQASSLDVLEKLLDEIDKGKTTGGAASVSSKPKQPAGPTPEEIAALQAEQNRIEFEEKQARQQVIDQQKLEEQKQALLEEMANGSANVARAQQAEELQKEIEEKKQAEEGFEIDQLDHTKI